MLSKCGHGHLHIWTRKKNFARVPKAAHTSNHQKVSFVVVALSTYTPVPFCHSCISCLYYFACLSCQGCPKIPILYCSKGGGVEEWQWTAAKVLFPFRGVANCNVLKASHVSCQLSWSPLPPGPPLACPPAPDQWQWVVCQSPPEHKTSFKK